MLKTIFIILIFIVTLTFIFQNQSIFIHSFSINYDLELFKINNISINNSILMISSFILGALISLVLIGSSLYKKSIKNNELKKKIIAIENNEGSKRGIG